MPNLWIIFLTGLTVGGLTCLAVQGGLLASVIASREEEDLESGNAKKPSLWPITAFLAAKFVAYTFLGFLLGLFGQALSLSDNTRAIMQLLAGVYMVLVALNLLEVHPIFRYVILQPPKFLTRKIRNQSRSKDIFAPALLGAMTVFIPCGTTLAMEALAISTGNPLWGALVMGVFVLATTPMFFGLGVLTAKLGDLFRKKFLKIAAIAVIYLGVTSINGSLILLDAPITLEKLAQASPIQVNLTGEEETAYTGTIVDGIQSYDINITSAGYSPNYLQVKKDEKVRLNLHSSDVYSCALAFRIPSLGIVKNLKPTGDDSVEFTPIKSGRITFACSMGMYSGIIEVI